MQTILLIEDNEAICMGLEYLLVQEKFNCLVAKTKREALEKIAKNLIDLILLDVGLPDGNGFDLCRKIKQETSISVIFLTAKDEEKNVVLGFDLGADDYVIKPFRNRELVSRIKNILRRNSKDTIISYADIRMDTESKLVYRDTKELKLTKLEYKILLILFSNPKKLFTREEILNNIWDVSGNFVNDNTLTVTIKRLREKIDDKDGKIIKTVRGMGYRLGDADEYLPK